MIYGPIPNLTCRRFALAILLIAGSSLAAEADEPSLAETLQWIDNTYNRHNGSLGHGVWETYLRAVPESC
jgi:hypothetical protein